MSRTVETEAIVLRTFDVGEADRLCILLTREQGKLAARAAGARRLHSRLGASLLPLQVTAVSLAESKSGWQLRGAEVQHAAPSSTPEAWCELLEVVELICQLTEDGHPCPEIFTPLYDRLTTTTPAAQATLGCEVRLLEALGLLPTDTSLPPLNRLSSTAQEELAQLRSRSTLKTPASSELRLFIRQLRELQLNAPLRATHVRAHL
jgi:DNA repair protein RecO